MLKAVLDAVLARGWFDGSHSYETAVYLSQGASLWVVLTRRGRPDTFVKFSQLVSLADEARRCEEAAKRYPRHAPRFIGYERRGNLELMATEAIDFRPVSRQMLLDARDAEALRSGISAYFVRMREAGPVGVGDAPHAWFETLARFYDAHPLRARIGQAVAVLADALPHLPALPQHGDFVVNNLGLRPGARLAVFDWEDSGSLRLPGLDLFTLEWSLAQELSLPGPDLPARASRAFDRTMFCAAMGLDEALYHRLRPAYGLAFRWLKRNYGPGIQQRLDELLDRLLPMPVDMTSAGRS